MSCYNLQNRSSNFDTSKQSQKCVDESAPKKAANADKFKHAAMAAAAAARVKSAAADNAKQSASHTRELGKKAIRKLNSVVRKDSFILQQPVTVEASIPEDLENSFSHKSFDLRTFVKNATTRYMRSNLTRTVILLASVVSCVVYVVETYLRRDGNLGFLWFAICTDIGTFIIFGIDYFFNIMYAHTKLYYVFSFQGLVDFASLLSIVNLFSTTADLSFLPLFRLTRVLKVLRLFRTANIVNAEKPTPPSASEAIFFEIASLVITIFLFIFLAASVLFTIIQQDTDAFIYNTNQDFNMKHEITWFDCVYIVMVVISTLGFGDFTPNNTTGRVFVVALVVVVLTVIPYKAGQLADMVAKRPRYMNEYVSKAGQPHIVICASFTSDNFQQLVTLILSEGTNDPEVIEDAVPIALLCPIFPTAQLELLLVHPMNARKVQFFVGSPKSERDLRRVKAHHASAIFVIADSNNVDAIDVVDQDDYSTKLMIVSIVNFISSELAAMEKARPRPTLICQTVSHEVCFSLLNFGVDRILSANNMKYSIMAYASLFPGFLSIISNLAIPSSVYHKRGTTVDPTNWKNEFEWGNSFQLIEVSVAKNIGNDFKRLSFSQACRLLYQWSKGTTICVAVFGHKMQQDVILNPERNAKIGDCKTLFLMTNNLEYALAMVRTENLLSVIRRLRSIRTNSSDHQSASRTLLTETGSEDEDVEEGAGRLELDNRPALALSGPPRSRAYTDTVCHVDPDTPKRPPLVFERHKSAYRLSISNRRSASDNGESRQDSVSEETAEPVISLVSESNIDLDEIGLGSTNKTAVHGNELSWIPQSNIQAGSSQLRHKAQNRFRGHVVLICAHSPNYAIARIVAAIDTFMNATRTKSYDHIVVLSSRAYDLEDYCRKKVAERNEEFDGHLTFIKGVPNTIRGLQKADVCFARCVVIIGNEYKSTDDSSGDMQDSNSDLYIVLAALEMDSVMNLYISRCQKQRLSANIPYIVQEVYNPTTVNFLPDEYTMFTTTSIKPWYKFDRAPLKSGRGIELVSDLSFDTWDPSPSKAYNLEYKSGRNRKRPDDDKKHKRDRISTSEAVLASPAYAQGRVMLQQVIASLTVSSLYNPNIIEFWQVFMGMEKKANTSNLENMSGILQQGKFDKLKVPTGFVGTFENLFELLLSSYGSIAIGLHRYPPNQSSYVAIMPPHNSHVGVDDQVFVLLTADPPNIPRHTSRVGSVDMKERSGKFQFL